MPGEGAHRVGRRDFLKGLVAAAMPVGSPFLQRPDLRISSTAISAGSGSSKERGWSGLVRRSQGGPLSGARVTLTSADGRVVRETRSDAAGRYRFADVPRGNATLGASAPGLEYVEASGASAGLDFLLAAESEAGRWRIIGDTEPEAFGGTNSGVLMPDGRVIYCHDTEEPVIFDPRDGNKAFPPRSPSVQGCHMVTHLPDGRVLYVGGGTVDDARNFNGFAVNTVKAYDPASNSWEVFPSLSEKRWYPGLTRLADGRFLVFGGGGQPERIRVESCEIFDPLAKRWTATGSMTAPGGFGPTMELFTGEVFVGWYPPQLYNVQTGQWRNTGMFRQPLRNTASASVPIVSDHPDFSGILLDDGRVAAIGTRKTAGGVMVEYFDPASGQWALGTSPTVQRSMCEVLRLPTGEILVAGGKNESDVHGVEVNPWNETRLVDLLNPVTGTWREMASMNFAREYHAITMLVPDGRVVTTAGTAQPGVQPPAAASRSIEAFEPPYLFRGPRPRISSVSKKTFANGESFSFEVANTSAITAALFVGVGAITHWMDGGVQRRLSLPFTQTGQTVTATIPSNPIVAMPGFYIMFAMVDDIPSQGEIVQVTNAQPTQDLFRRYLPMVAKD